MYLLSEAKTKNAKPKAAMYRLSDGGGLYLYVMPSGAKTWRLRKQKDGREKIYTLGHYPSMGLKDARRAAAAFDPAALEQEKKEKKLLFGGIAEKWLALKGKEWRANYYRTQRIRYEKYIKPSLGGKDITEIERGDIAEIINAAAGLDMAETARRIYIIISAIFDYAIAAGLTDSNPCFYVKPLLPPVKNKPMAAITTPAGAGALMRAINDFDGSFIVKSALLFSAYTFCRPGEIRQAEWAEIDFDSSMWTIPAEKMKMDRPHLVPLARQVLDLLEELKVFTGAGRYVFPSAYSMARPLSDNAVRGALRRLGYSKEEMTAHGFRSMASTLLNEKGEKFDVIEAQLAHAGYDKIRAIYNRADYMRDRRLLMQTWADYLDALAERKKS